MSAPVSNRYEMRVFLSNTKMRRDLKPSSLAAITDGWPRFPISNCMVSCIFSRVPQTSRGKNIKHLATVDLRISNGGGISYVVESRLSAVIHAQRVHLRLQLIHLLSQRPDGGGGRIARPDVFCRWIAYRCYYADRDNMSWVRAYLVDAVGNPGQRFGPLILHGGQDMLRA